MKNNCKKYTYRIQAHTFSDEGISFFTLENTEEKTTHCVRAADIMRNYLTQLSPTDIATVVYTYAEECLLREFNF